LCYNITIVSSGDIKLILAAKVDVRDGLAWSSLDKYIKNIEGGGPGVAGLQAHPNDDAAAAVTAAGVADSEEDTHAGMNFRVNSICQIFVCVPDTGED